MTEQRTTASDPSYAHLHDLSPETVRRWTPEQCERGAEDIRSFLVERVTRAGGHLGPNLGVVELTIALHRVFDSPRDVLLFDTGHQSYVHKILTGRAAEFGTLRQAGGLSGYPCPAESPHDFVENSHASTALSYADGIAKAFALRGEPRRVVAVVGDGALTGGMSWEALNNLGGGPLPVVVVVNDNERSYAPTAGALAHHLARLRGGDPGATNLFDQLGLAYLGPVDGHDIAATEQALRQARTMNRAVVVHCVTRKGAGHRPAEDDEADRMHAIGPADAGAGRSWTSVFGEEIDRISAVRPDVVCVTAAMALPAGLGPLLRRAPERVFDVGIAEQHAVTSAAGLAIGGLHPVVAVYSTFLTRALDQVLMDVALHRLPVTFVLDRAGITGPDGPSHHGMWDASLLALVPGLRLAAPRDCTQLRQLLREAVSHSDGPTAVRFPKGTAGAEVPAEHRAAGYDVLHTAPDARVLIISVGPMAEACLEAARDLHEHGTAATVIDPRWISPLTPELVKLAGAHQLVVTVEDATATGSVGGRLAQALAASGSATRTVPLALPAAFVAHGSRRQILRAHGLDAAGIAGAVLKHLDQP
ncbi:1-deoxy-D-xylulose-5-phosphate synthase [Actinoplanes sp. HUAS TT8]|uniref:1-deoxy-D-xylulose-5-phosphate synthase n=1 Tax=Actinoplanes sp. HUAS TT8 TaxID=3447453 RepID=UPI003F51D0AB